LTNHHENSQREHKRRYNQEGINTAFNDFLRIHQEDIKLLHTNHNALMQGAEQFAKIFYDYLLTNQATAKVLEDYQASGGEIKSLVKTQLQHLFDFLAGHTDADYAQRMAHIGEVHYRYGIEPVWIMGAYLLYLDHLEEIIHTNPEIKESDRGKLDDSVTKLLFRDMGLMLEGYWDASARELGKQQTKIVELQGQITSLLSNIPQLLWSVDVAKNRALYISPTTRDICDINIDMPIPCLGWTIPEDQETVRRAWQKALEGNKVEVESRVRHPEGTTRWFRRVFYPFKDSEGQVVRVDGLMEDTTDTKEMIERLHTLATTDSLTGLTNRTLLHDRLNQAITAASRRSDRDVVLMLMDLDHFKEINDTLGHVAGDQVLIQVARRLATGLRETDTLARLGGDEFAILLPDVKNGRRTGEKVAKSLLKSFIAPYIYEDNELYLGAGIGIVIYPEHGEDVATLMSRADVAMYGTKNKDMNYLFYDTALDPNAQLRLQLSTDLRHALARAEFVLYYQPKIDMKSRLVMGAEALIRWQHPEHGLLAPDRFIPLAERTGLISPITDWVIDTAAKQCHLWHDAGQLLRMAVNVPARTFQDIKLINKLKALLRKHRLPSECLEIEITENLLMSDIEHISGMLEKIRRLGITVAIDDFGTGYSSLAYLKRLSLQTLKIDQSFVIDMTRDENDAAIVRSTIDLAHNLGYNVVAEGIENQEAWDMLATLGCDGAQGNHIARPMPAEDFTRWLKQSPWKVSAD
jgi:diguanylate cyclase (GGDEF)-like protein